MINFKSKSQKYILVSLIVIFIIGLSIFYFKKPKTNEPTVSNEKEHVVPARPKTFNESAGSLIEAIKLARVSAFKYDVSSALFYTNDALALWRDTVNEFINISPPDEITADVWTATMTKIFESIQETEKFLKANDYGGAIKNLDDCQILLNDIYDIEKNNPSSDRLFSILLIVKKIKDTKTLEEAKPLLGDLKMSYTKFKELPDQDKLIDKINYFEAVISEIENSTPIIFPRALEKLEPAFFDIYENY